MKTPVICSHCSNDDYTLLDLVATANKLHVFYCIVCGKNFHVIADESRPDNQANQISKQQPE